MSLRPASSREILIATIADLLTGVRTVAVGASSPIPAAGAMLLRARNEARGRERIRIAVLGSREHNFFTNGAFELFDCAAQGRIDAFFLGGGQIDGQANINLVGIGDYQAQARQCFANLKSALNAINSGPERVVRMSINVVDHRPDLLGPIFDAGREIFRNAWPMTAAILLGVQALGVPGWLVEIDAVVSLPE